MRSISAAIAARGAPRAPVPSSASTTRPTLGQGPSGATSRTPSARARAAIASRSSAAGPGGAVTHTGTSSRWRARATHPSVAAVVARPGGDQHAVAQPVGVAGGEHRGRGAAGALHQGGERDRRSATARGIPGSGLFG